MWDQQNYVELLCVCVCICTGIIFIVCGENEFNLFQLCVMYFTVL